MAQELITIQGGTCEVTTAEKTFSDVVEEWLKYLADEKRKKERTISVYRYNMGVFKDWLDSEGIERATREDIKAWAKFMTAQGWKVSTKNLYLTTVRNFYKWLADEYNFENIAAGIDGWKNTKEHKRGTLDCADMKKLLAVVPVVAAKKLAAMEKKLAELEQAAQAQGKTLNCDGRRKYYEKQFHLQELRDRAILSALMAGGLRTIEICRLRVIDIGVDGGVYFLNVLGKGRDERELVKISRKAERVIRDWLNAREAVDVVSDESPLFCSIANNSFGEPLTSLSISRLVKEYLLEAKVKNKTYETEQKTLVSKPVVAHSLRASLATNAFRKGASLTAVQQQLRHRNLATTQIYLEESEKFKNPVSDLVSNEIF